MRTLKPFLSLLLGVLWLLPSLAACAVGLHLVVEHGAHEHGADGQAGIEHGHAHHEHGAHGHDEPAEHEHSGHEHSATTIAEVLFHGHHHEEAEPSDHSHGVTVSSAFTLAKLSPKSLLLESSSVTSPTSPALPIHGVAWPEGIRGSTDRGSPPLFTAHCSLLI